MIKKKSFKFVLAILFLCVGFALPSWSQDTTDQFLGSWIHRGASCGLENPIVGTPTHSPPRATNTYNPDGTGTLELKQQDCSMIIEFVYTVSGSSMEVENKAVKVDEECFKKMGMSEDSVNHMKNSLIEKIGLGTKRVANFTFRGNSLYLEDPTSRTRQFCNEEPYYNILEKQD